MSDKDMITACPDKGVTSPLWHGLIEKLQRRCQGNCGNRHPKVGINEIRLIVSNADQSSPFKLKQGTTFPVLAGSPYFLTFLLLNEIELAATMQK
ncbi:MAG: hypothetical protein ABW148_09010 [Sedimenticola sp.]